MSAKWKYRDEGKKISKSVISSKSTEELVAARDFIKGLLDLRKSEKLAKTYIKGTKEAIKNNGRDKIYVDFRFDGTATGRLSCAAYSAEKAMGVSFHTLPRETENNIRSIFIGPKGYAFITVDYSAMELRVLSHIAKEGNMQIAFNSGQDLHTYTASLLFAKDKSKVTKKERQIAKTVSFLIVYGGGAFNLSETMGISVRQANKIISGYKDVYPGVFEFMEFINEFIKDNKYSYTIFGRRRNLSDVDSRNFSVVNRAYRQGLNFTIQSAASDILLCSLIGIYNEFKADELAARVVSTVHDSIEIVCPVEEIEQVCKVIREQMIDYPFMKENFGIHFDVPFEIEVLVGHSFGDGIEVEYSGGGITNLKEITGYLSNE